MQSRPSLERDAAVQVGRVLPLFFNSILLMKFNQSRYRREFWNFRTPSGVVRKCVCITAGANERARLIVKGEQMAKNNGWKLL